MLEKLLANYCAPALAGIKPSSIVTYRKCDGCDPKREISRFNAELNACGIFAEILCECKSRAIIIAYRKNLLEKQLNDGENRAFLNQYGYENAKCLADFLSILKTRLTCDSFPHEIGVFLGYPLYDVYAFINHRDEGCIMTGDWRVYHNADEAEKTFRRFRACKRALSRRITSGMSLGEIFRTA